MKVYVKNIGKEPGCIMKNGRLLFFFSRPTVVQPSEIIRAQTEAFIKVEGRVIISITTHPQLATKACEVFPAVIIIDDLFDYTRPLEIPLRNCGRNPLNKMPGDLMALGYVSSYEEIQIEDWDFSAPNPAEQNNVPQKKNTGIRFEVK